MKLHELVLLAKIQNWDEGNKSEQQIRDYLQEQGIHIENMYQELEMDSQFVDTHRDVSYAAEKVQFHSHTFFEIIYCASNSGIQYLIGTERYRLQRGDIVFVPPGIGHKPLLTEELAEPYRRDVLWLSEEFVERFGEICPDTWKKLRMIRGLFRTAGTRWEGLADYFHNGVRESEREEAGWQAALYGNAIQFLVQFSRAFLESDSGAAPAEKSELLDEVMTFIEQNLKQRITLSDTAKRFWVSESTISQIFKQKVGVSFYHFVTQRRLIMAKSMILEGKQLEEIGEKVGFADYSTFYRAFKQEYGISPRQYRKMQEGM